MSLETQIANLVGATTSLTNEVSGKMGQIDALINGFINNWGITGSVTLEVGPGKPFATIAQAWSSLSGKSIKGGVTIKVAPGIYTMPVLHLLNPPSGARVSIVGEPTNPAACVLRFEPDASGYSHGLIADGVTVRLAGFRLESPLNGGVQRAHRMLLATNGGYVFCDAETVQISGGIRGLLAGTGGCIVAPKISISDAITGVQADVGGLIWCERASVTAAGQTVPTPTGVQDTYGYRALGGIVMANGASVSGALYGFLSNAGGLVHANALGSSDSDRARAINCQQGFVSAENGVIMAVGALAQQCQVYGYRADARGLIQARGSHARQCGTGYFAWAGGQIEALDTNANLVSVSTPYSPANHAVLGNENAMIRRS
ncbi:MAG: hypothetical protein N2690_05855 [Rhodocyclaceae bacterium]|nr:hypothetical protein [Rhodocyclaceae bacterium]